MTILGRQVHASEARRMSAVAVVVGAMAVSGCTKTLFFMEQSSTKLGIAVGNDPTSPLEVTAGVKRKVLSVTPPKEPARSDEQGNRIPTGEPVSVVSRFDLSYAGSAAGPFGGKLTITNAFASGEAGRLVAGSAPATARLLGERIDTSGKFDPATGDPLDPHYRAIDKFIFPNGADSLNEQAFQSTKKCMSSEGAPNDDPNDLVQFDKFWKKIADCLRLSVSES